MTKFLSSLDWRHWLLTHLLWIVALGVGYAGFSQWKYEHDTNAAKAVQIAVAQNTITQLNAQIIANNTQAAQKVTTITKIVHDVTTPAQAVAAIPILTNIPLNARVIPGNAVDVEVAALPLVDLIGQYQIAQTNLSACQANITAEKAIVVQQAGEIATLKKKPPLKQRIVHALKVGGTIFGIGVVIGAHFL